MLIQYDTYGREQDMEQLRAEDISFDGKHVALMFGVSARGESVKTGSNQGVIICRSPVADVCLGLRPKTGAEKLFKSSQVQFRKLWHKACGALGISFTGPPHSLRHAGPSEDISRGRASLEVVRRRGRWRSMDSVQRYSKTFALTKYRSRMPETIRLRGERIAADLRGHLVEALMKLKTSDKRKAAVLTALRRSACNDWQLECGDDGGQKVSDDEGWMTE